MDKFEIEILEKFGDVQIWKDPWKTDHQEVLKVARIPDFDIDEFEKFLSEKKIEKNYFFFDLENEPLKQLERVLIEKDITCSSRLCSFLVGFETAKKIKK